MLKKFYIVNDHKDLLSGQIIPHKVLNYLPASAIFPTSFQPVPIQKFTGLEISPVSPMGLMPFGSPMLGPPIIKYSPLMVPGAEALIHIIFGNNRYTIVVPFNNIRDITRYIYLNANANIDPTKPKVTFRFVTPGLDTNITTTFDKMIEMIRYISVNYPQLSYRYPNGDLSNLMTLVNLLNELSKNNLSNINVPNPSKSTTAPTTVPTTIPTTP